MFEVKRSEFQQHIETSLALGMSMDQDFSSKVQKKHGWATASWRSRRSDRIKTESICWGNLQTPIAYSLCIQVSYDICLHIYIYYAYIKKKNIYTYIHISAYLILSNLYIRYLYKYVYAYIVFTNATKTKLVIGICDQGCLVLFVVSFPSHLIQCFWGAAIGKIGRNSQQYTVVVNT